MNYKEDICVDVSDIIKRLQGKIKLDFEVERMEPLFENKEAYSSFTERHNKAKVPTADLASYSGNCYLGIDAGSTTTKVALVGEDGKLLYSFTAVTMVLRLPQQYVPSKTFIQSSLKMPRLYSHALQDTAKLS